MTRTIENIKDIKQLTRTSGSSGANYIEANEAVSQKDFLMRIKICRKKSKESRFFLRLMDTNNNLELEKERDELMQESTKLMKIFGSIVTKVM